MGRYAPMTELKKRRKALGLTQAKLAEIIGVRQTTLSQYENGDCFPRRDKLEEIANALGCEVKDLL